MARALLRETLPSAFGSELAGFAVTDTYGKLREFVRNFVKEQAPGGRIEEHEVPRHRSAAASLDC